MDKYYMNVLAYDWGWLDKYANCYTFISNLQLDFEDILFKKDFMKN